MTKRDELIEQLEPEPIMQILTREYLEKIADFILERDKKILEPLVKLDLKPGTVIELSMKNMSNILEAVMQTLNNAGLGE